MSRNRRRSGSELEAAAPAHVLTREAAREQDDSEHRERVFRVFRALNRGTWSADAHQQAVEQWGQQPARQAIYEASQLYSYALGNLEALRVEALGRLVQLSGSSDEEVAVRAATAQAAAVDRAIGLRQKVRGSTSHELRARTINDLRHPDALMAELLLEAWREPSPALLHLLRTYLSDPPAEVRQLLEELAA